MAHRRHDGRMPRRGRRSRGNRRDPRLRPPPLEHAIPMRAGIDTQSGYALGVPACSRARGRSVFPEPGKRLPVRAQVLDGRPPGGHPWVIVPESTDLYGPRIANPRRVRTPSGRGTPQGIPCHFSTMTTAPAGAVVGRGRVGCSAAAARPPCCVVRCAWQRLPAPHGFFSPWPGSSPMWSTSVDCRRSSARTTCIAVRACAGARAAVRKLLGREGVVCCPVGPWLSRPGRHTTPGGLCLLRMSAGRGVELDAPVSVDRGCSGEHGHDRLG